MSTSSNVSSDYAAALSAVSSSSITFTRYWCITMFIVGFIGHSLNLCVFARPALRSNSCARYFMASTIAGHCIILIVLPIRLIQFGYGISLFIRSVFLCKFLTFLFSWFRILPCWFIALASADRFWCSSASVVRRSWSSIRISNRLILLTTVLIGLTQVPFLIFYTINTQPVVCLGQPNLFQQINGFFILVIWSMIPCIAMFIFASGAIGGTFNILDDNSRKDALVLAKQGLIGNVLSFVGLLGPCISFYLCTLSSQLFRHEFLALLHFRREHPPDPIADMIPMQQRNA
ncbi:hypothetical protein I4U23_001451 [Adineta vaga]|nr:hypothetical protein I4U23_001451 [Adineta vaga]